MELALVDPKELALLSILALLLVSVIAGAIIRWYRASKPTESRDTALAREPGEGREHSKSSDRKKEVQSTPPR